MIDIHCTLFLTIVFPEFFVMAHLECYRETETAIFATRTNLPVSDFQTWQVWCEPTGTSQKLGNLGGNKGGADCNVFEKVGMVEECVKKR